VKPVISSQELRRVARGLGVALDLVEKDYALGWMLFGIASSSMSSRIAFKGGTALSKVYFPGQWRLSEDLDFTLLDDTEPGDLLKALSEEVLPNVQNASGIPFTPKKAPFINPTYLQARFQYVGPVSRNTLKVEISKEGFVGDVIRKGVPQAFDYPRFEVTIYSLENILAEKIRTLLERGKVKDYYDVWKLLKVGGLDGAEVKHLFLEKCRAKGVAFNSVEQLFPPDLTNTLKPYVKMGLTRLSSEPLPPIESLVDESKAKMTRLLA
jgi:predicted nucleotidyltransferase component of viral defense system